MNIMDILYVPMGYIMRFVSALTNNNYLSAILLFALIIEILMIPLQIKMQKNSIAQAKLQPKLRAITKKFDGLKDQASLQKRQELTMELYQKENFSPYSGCLPMLIQLPIVLALYRVIMSPLRYICGLAKDSISVIEKVIDKIDVEAGLFETMEAAEKAVNTEIKLIQRLHDSNVFDKCVAEVPELAEIADKLPNFNIGPFDFSLIAAETGFIWWLWAIPVLVFLGQWLSTKLMRKFTYQPPESADMQNGTGMKVMNVAFPVMSGGIAFSMPAAVGVYWFVRGLISVAEKFIISKAMPIPVISEEEFKAAEREYGAKVKGKKEKKERDPSKPRPRSLHRIDFDDEPLPPAVPDKEETDKGDGESGDSPAPKAPLK
ncbi:MAG: membrane protein insertase YidC [Clostridia bacterium]|nr:membrane protein insertase YidC [Clostridia bacterium]